MIAVLLTTMAILWFLAGRVSAVSAAVTSTTACQTAVMPRPANVSSVCITRRVTSVNDVDRGTSATLPHSLARVISSDLPVHSCL